MKKRLSTLAMILACTLVFASCGKNKDNNSEGPTGTLQKPGQVQNTPTTPDPTPAPTPDPTPSPTPIVDLNAMAGYYCGDDDGDPCWIEINEDGYGTYYGTYPEDYCDITWNETVISFYDGQYELPYYYSDNTLRIEGAYTMVFNRMDENSFLDFWASYEDAKLANDFANEVSELIEGTWELALITVGNESVDPADLGVVGALQISSDSYGALSADYYLNGNGSEESYADAPLYVYNEPNEFFESDWYASFSRNGYYFDSFDTKDMHIVFTFTVLNFEGTEALVATYFYLDEDGNQMDTDNGIILYFTR